MMWRSSLFRLCSSILFVTALSGCSSFGGGVKGDVREVVYTDGSHGERKEIPASNSFVLVEWSGIVPRPVDATSVCLHASIVATDANGHFEVPGWVAFPKPYFVYGVGHVTRVYKPGFEITGFDEWGEKGTITLVRSSKSAVERLNVLDDLARYPFCSERNDNIDASRQILHDYYQAIYDEVIHLNASTTFWTKGLPDFLENKLSLGRKSTPSPRTIVPMPAPMPAYSGAGNPAPSAAAQAFRVQGVPQNGSPLQSNVTK